MCKQFGVFSLVCGIRSRSKSTLTVRAARVLYTHEDARETNRERLRATRDVVDAPGDDDARDDDDVVEGNGFWIARRTVLILDAEVDPWDRVSWRPG